MSKKERNPRSTPTEADAEPTELNEDALEDISGGPTRRTEDFGDHIGNYNFKVEIDGVDAGQVMPASRQGKNIKR